MPILAAFMVPHPPMIVPQVGRGSEKQVEKTIRAYEQVAREIADLKPETILISSPHATMYLDYFHISPGREATGSFRDFRAPQVRFHESYDRELVEEIRSLAQAKGFPAGTMGEREKWLDHGTMVPLWFIRQHYKEGKIVRIGLSGMPLTRHYEMGQLIAEAVRMTGRRVVYVASGDLSHKLQSYGPYGFAPEGPQYDERIMDVCSRGAFGELFDFDETFCEKAAECGHRSFVIMAGVLDGMAVKAEQLSHEDVTGVGYGICSFYPEEIRKETLEKTLGKTLVKTLGTLQEKTLGTPQEKIPGRNQEEIPGRNLEEILGKDPDRCFLDRYLAECREKLQAQREHSDAYVRLARKSLETYIREGRVIPVPGDGAADDSNFTDTGNNTDNDVNVGAGAKADDDENVGIGVKSGNAAKAGTGGKAGNAEKADDSVNAGEGGNGVYCGNEGNTGGADKADETDKLPAEMKQNKAGVFVSIHEHGKLRGCIGTIRPVTDCIASEIIRNAISASTEDPRFDPITEEELDWLEIHVDVLGKTEPIDSPDELDVKRYGVIVSHGWKRGLLLPDLDGVDTVQQQIDIARQKAGIGPREPVKLERFEVVRHQ